MEIRDKGCVWVFFMNFLFDHCVKLRTDVILADRDTGELFSDRMRQAFIVLPLFNKEKDTCENDFERWIFQELTYRNILFGYWLCCC